MQSPQRVETLCHADEGKLDINLETSDGVGGLHSLSSRSRTPLEIPKEEYRKKD
jgi:hypothetical protein